MRILELHITEFGSLKDLDLAPGKGLTVIYGENESGKSTVWLFIKFMLYGLPKRGSVERERAVSRDGHRAAGRMTVQVGEEIYQIDRSLVDGARATEKVSVCRVRDGENIFAGQVPGEALLGVPREVFENSCGVGQSLCTGISGKKEATAIQNLLTSADETVEIDKIVARLEEIRVRYRYKKGSGGRLYELEKEIHAQKGRLDEATDNYLRKTELSQKLESGGKQLRLCEEKLTEAENLEKEIAKIELLRRFDAMRENEKKAEEVRAERRELARRERKTDYTPTAMDVTGLRLLAESLKRAELALDRARAAYTQTEKETVDEGVLEQARRMEADGGKERILKIARDAKRRLTFGKTLLGIGCALFAVGLGAFLWFYRLYLLLLVGAGVAFFVASMMLLATGKGALKKLVLTYGAEPDGLEGRLCFCEAELKKHQRISEERLERKAEELAARDVEERARADLREALCKTNVDSAATVEGAWIEMRRLDAYLLKDNALQQREKLLTQLVENDRRILSPYNESELRAGLTLQEELSADAVERMRRERSAYAEKVRLLRLQEEQLRNELISRNARGEDPMVIADRLTELYAALEGDTFYYEAVEGALEGLRQAGEAMRGNLTPVISRNAGGMMEYISDGRYEQMRVASSMNLSLVEEDQAATAADLLSGGTRDAAYVSLRIALMMQIFGDELPPLMMDETLCQVDDRRVERILTLLGKLAENRLQCLIFTCHRREAEICRKLGIDCTEITLNV